MVVTDEIEEIVPLFEVASNVQIQLPERHPLRRKMRAKKKGIMVVKNERDESLVPGEIAKLKVTMYAPGAMAIWYERSEL